MLQEREFQRLGGTRPVKADIRIIAATNRDLGAAMERGDFRDDLYYRLQVFGIRIPPLRERPEDIIALTAQFLDDLGRSFGRAPVGITHDAKAILLAHPWRGNARELRNALERAAIVAEGGLIAPEHLSIEPTVSRQDPATTDIRTIERASHRARAAGDTRQQIARRQTSRADEKTAVRPAGAIQSLVVGHQSRVIGSSRESSVMSHASSAVTQRLTTVDSATDDSRLKTGDRRLRIVADEARPMHASRNWRYM